MSEPTSSTRVARRTPSPKSTPARPERDAQEDAARASQASLVEGPQLSSKSILALQRTAGNVAVARLLAGTQAVQRDGRDWKGPSYARQGPPGSAVADKRAALTPLQNMGEAEKRLAAETAKSVGWIGEGVTKLFVLEAEFRQSKTDGKPFMGDSTLEFASRLHQIAEALQKLSTGVLGTTAKVKDANASLERFEQMDHATKGIGALVNGLQLVSSGQKTNAALEQFKAKPNQQTAEAWADSVVDSFDLFGKTIGSLELPPWMSFILEYYQGLMGAPKAYVTFFKSTMHMRYDKINEQVGWSDKYQQFLRQGEKIMWAGPSCDLVSRAWLFDAHLQEWIFAHTKLGERKLWDFGTADVAAMLVDALGRDESVAAETRERWMAWLGSRK